MEIDSRPTKATLQLLQRSLQDVTPKISTQTNLGPGCCLEMSTMEEEASQSESLAGMSDESLAPVRNDSALPEFTSKPTKTSQITEPETGVIKSGYEKLRAAIRKDLQSDCFGIPHVPVQNIEVPTQNLARYQFPPASMFTSSPSRHRRRFDRSVLLPDSNLPFCGQIMEHVKDWAEWGTRIADDQRRKEVLDHVFSVLSKAWFEALRLGYNPGTTDARRTIPQVPTKRSAHHGEELPAGLPRGRPRLKREASPSKMPVLVANHKDGPAWAITAGELEEAGISESQIRMRAAAKNTLEAGDKLLDEVLQDYGKSIQPSDWYGIMEVTRLNPKGRDLMVYCLYEVLKIRDNISQLWKFYHTFQTNRQKDNTKKRIDEEQERHDLFMALALELNEEKSSPGDSTASDTSTIREGSMTSSQTTTGNETIQTNQLDTLIRLSEVILEGTDGPFIPSIFERFEISQDDLVTDVSMEGTSLNFNQCKHVLNDLLFYGREWLRLTNNTELDKDVNLRTQVQNLELEIVEKKKSLGILLPSLIVERDATRENVEGGGASTEAHSTVTGTTVPTDDILMTEATSPAPSKNIAKHHPNFTDGEVSLPPMRSPKTDNEGDNPDSPLTVLLNEQVSHNIHEIGKQNIKGGQGLSGASHSGQTSKGNGRDLRVTLRVRPHFEPTDFTSKRVFCHPKGFKYRYTSESTLVQRWSMTQVLDKYVQLSMKKRKRFDPNWRFGKYQALGHPDDPQRTSIIHGIWDLENGKQPEGFEWFYKGDGTHPSEQEEVSPPQDGEVEEVLPVPPPPKEKPVVLSERTDAVHFRQEGSLSKVGNANDTAINSHSKKRSIIGSRDKNKKQSKNRHVRFSAEPSAVAQADYEESVSINQPKRTAAARKLYVEGYDDDDYCPSE